MIKVPVDEVWVRRMAGLADGPWTEGAVTAAFTEYGWTSAICRSGDGEAYLPWYDMGDLVTDDPEVWSGWTMYFGEAPPEDEDTKADPYSRLELWCAAFWPAFGAEDTGERSDNPYDACNELLAIADEWIACVAEPAAKRAAFVAEFERIRALTCGVLGPPTRTAEGENGAVHAVWERAAACLVLVMEPCEMNYEADDWIALRVCPPGAA